MRRSLTNYHIKLLAAALMVVDHIGAIFFPNISILRVLGRLSFPLFAWLLVQGETHTKNIWKYALRLLLLGVVSQPIYLLLFETPRLNILFSLLLGLLCIRAARAIPRFQLFTWFGGGVLAHLANFEYGGYGIAIIALLWQFKPNPVWCACWVLLHLIILFVPEYGSFQFPAIFAPLPLLIANHQPGAKARWFYLFYPLHLLVLFLIEM